MADWDVSGEAPISGPNDWDVASHAPQVTGPMRIPAMIASKIGEGLADTAAVPGEMFHLGGQLRAKVNDWLGAQNPDAPSPLFSSIEKHAVRAGDVSNFGKHVGLWDRPDLEPQSNAEQYISAGAQGVGSTIPALMTEGTSLIPTLAAGATSGVGSKFGHDALPEHPILGSLLGGTAGGMGIGSFMNAGAKGVNALRGVGNDMTDAYTTAGITPRLAGDVTESPTLQGVQAFAAKSPLGMTRVAGAAHATADEFGSSAERVASGLGPAATAQDVGTSLQGEGAKWMQKFKATNAGNWNSLDQYFSDPVPVSNYRTALNGIQKTLPDAPATARTLQPNMTRQLLDDLQADAPGNNGLSWQSVKGIRSRIGEMLEDPNLPGDTGTAELKRLYGGLSEDMKSAAYNASIPVNSGMQRTAAQLFDDANTFTRNGHSFIDGVLRPVMRQGQTPEGAATSVLNSLTRGGTTAAQLRAEMPSAADNIGAYKIRDMASAVAGRQNAGGDAVSPSSFLTDWNKMSPEAKTAVFADPRVRTQLAALAKVSEGIKGTLAKVNSSNTAAHGDMKDLFGIPGRIAAGAYAGHELGGHYGMLGGAAMGASGPAGGYLAGRIAATPALTSYFAAPGLFNPKALRLGTALGTYSSMANEDYRPNLLH
jgi:hypothetical protein